MIDLLKPLIQQFMPFAQKQMGFNRPPKLFLRQDSQNSADPLGKTGFYDPANESITIYITDRHPKDIMRSLSHELMHHTQNCNGDFENVENMGEQGYAQNNSHLRSMEIQAYEASIVFRDWEDSIKGTIYNESLQKGVNKRMSIKNWKNEELKTLLTEKWGFSMNLDAFNERHEPGHEDSEENPFGSGVDKTDSTPSTMEKAGKQETRAAATSKRGIPSAAGSVAHPMAGRIDRTDIANKVPPEWIKEGNKNELFEQATATCKQRHELLGDKAVRGCIEEEMTRMMNEGCPHEEEEEEDLYEKDDHDWGMGKDEESRTRPGEEDYTGHKGDESRTHPGDEDYEPEEGGVEDHAMRAMKAIYDLADSAGVTLGADVEGPADDDGTDDEMDVEVEEEEELDERHKPPNVTQGREPGRRKKNINTGQRTIDEERIREIAKVALKHLRQNTTR